MRVVLPRGHRIEVFDDFLDLIHLDSSPDESHIIPQEHPIHSLLVLNHVEADHGNYLFQSDVAYDPSNKAPCRLYNAFIFDCYFFRVLAVEGFFIEKLDSTDSFELGAMRIQEIIICVNLGAKKRVELCMVREVVNKLIKL